MFHQYSYIHKLAILTLLSFACRLIPLKAAFCERPSKNIVESVKKIFASSVDSCSIIKPLNVTALTVLDFGAKPNDGLDDSKAFQKMLDSNLDLVIPAGTYNVDKTIIIKMKNNLQIFGLGIVNLVSADRQNAGIFSISESTGVLISNITFIGGVSVPNKRNIAIDFADKGNSYIGVFECKFSGTITKGFNIGINAQFGGSYFLVAGCTFDNLMGNTSGNGYGLHMAYMLNVRVCNNSFSGSTGRGRHAVYLSTGDQNCMVINNTMKNLDWSAINFNCYYYQVENKNNLVRNNTIIGGASAHWGIGQINVYGKCLNNTIDSNKLIGSKQMGICVNGNSGPGFTVEKIGTGTKVINNTIENCATYGITISGTNNIQIINNRITNAGISDVKGHGFSAIYIRANMYDKKLPPSHDIMIKNNIVSGRNVTRSSIITEKGFNAPYNISIDKNNVFPKLRISSVE